MIMLWMDNKMPSGVQVSRNWYNTLIWLKKHTPNPQGKIIAKNFDYAAGYYPIPKNLNIPYNYPKSAYGVMSWWDVGHQITCIAERIPNSNNYQQGIVEKNNTAGAALFFTSRNEKKAVKNLDVVGSRYIVIANDMLYSKFPGIVIWSGDTQGWTKNINKKIRLGKGVYKFNKLTTESTKFLQTMINRLFYNDTDGLQHFRLIYESEGDYLVNTRSVVVIPSARIIPGVLRFKNYAVALKSVKKLKYIVANKERTLFAYSARPPVKEAKIFEKVKGAVISGEAPIDAPDNTPVELMLKLKTKYKRVFTYTQTTKVARGKYQFIVPYPTTKMRGDGYSYDIQAVGDYQIKIKDQIIRVFVPEKAVMIGNTIVVK
jgi:dolichyl-diphosphooligosaccharide--protein glycosyltransferase